MKKSILIATSALLPIVMSSSSAIAQETSVVDGKYHSAKFKPRIIGGSQAQQGDIPWQVSLEGSGGGQFCGGSLIDKEWVLTAAHCVEGQSPQFLRVRVGLTDLQSNNGETRNISQIVIHPSYTQGASTDVALLKLTNPITNITPVALANTEVMQQSGYPGTTAMVSGWGNVSITGEEYPAKLMKVDVPLVSNEVCNRPESYGGQVAATEICAGFAQGGKDSCQGDSGGPLVIRHNDAWFQAGVVSWGDGCALENKYGVYARVSSFTDWIQKAIQGDDGSTNPPQPNPPQPNPPQPNPQPDPDPGTGPTDPSTNTGLGVLLSQPVSGSAGAEQVYKVEVTPNTRMLWVDTLGGSGDVDLFIAKDRQPTLFDYDYMYATDGNSEYYYIDMPEPGTYYIMLYGYTDYSNATLTAVTR